MINRKKASIQFQKLVELIDTLRGENGCPWDRKQTLENTRSYILEEVYELIEAISEEDLEKIKEELADVLFQCIFISRILEDDFQESLENIIGRNIEKMTQRHPHIFGGKAFRNEDELLENWEYTKKREGNNRESIFSDIVKTLPSLQLAQKVQEKASRVGFDWENAKGPIDKIREEINEFINIDITSRRELEDEFGDILFSMVNLSRFYKIDSEIALREAIKKFIRRFRNMEILISRDKKNLNRLSQDEMDDYWEKSKKITDS